MVFAIRCCVNDYSPAWLPKGFESWESPMQDLSFCDASEVFDEHGVHLDERRMERLGFYTDWGTYTNLALILSDQNSYAVKMTASGRGCGGVAARKISRRSAVRQLGDATDFVRLHDLVSEGLTRGHPADAVANALIHRDYSLCGPVRVALVGGDLEVVSPGGLPGRICIDDVMLGVSLPRNPRLAEAFGQLGLTDSSGVGIARIVARYRRNLLEPSIEASENAFRVTLPRTDIETDDPVAGMVARLLRQNGQMGRKELEEATGASRSKITGTLNQLIAQGVARSSGEGRGTKYELM